MGWYSGWTVTDSWRQVSIGALDAYCTGRPVALKVAREALKDYPDDARVLIQRHITEYRARLAALTALLLES